MASRREQKEAARRAREQAVAQLKAQHARRNRLFMLGGVVAIVIAAIVVVVVVSSSGGGSLKALTSKGLPSQKVDGAYYSPKQAVSLTDTLLAGLPEHGNVLGNPDAPVTITEYLDFVCPTCDDYALATEPQVISTEVRAGTVKLVYRADDTASSFANQNAWVTSQTAALAAGLQNKAWYYILLMYDEQPQTINGQDAEDVAYVNSAYMQNRAEQIKGLNLVQWQSNLTNPTLVRQTNADLAAAKTQAPRGTPTLIVSGAKGSVTWDANGQESAVPTYSQLAGLVSQVQ
ncbi:MAG: thioredoxin domain-containing protein [Solirubrobacteraceae bacterium]